MSEPSFPPLLSGQAVTGSADPFVKACSLALVGCDAGLVVYNLGANSLAAAIVFAPEVPLRQAIAMLPVAQVGFQNALGALAPPEVAVQFDWDGAMRINGALCGGFRVAASSDDPEAMPNWLVVGFSLPLWPETDRPGDTPDETTLYAEGCADVDAQVLLESWARHTLATINKWSEDGVALLHRDWCGLVPAIGEDLTMGGDSGVFLGVDEDFGLLLRIGETTKVIPMTTLLEQT
jgi:biotin-(acetyl-CoA carboxylase) ligase